MTRKKYLEIKFWCIQQLRRINILSKDKLYKGEIELSKIRGKEYAEFFRNHAP